MELGRIMFVSTGAKARRGLQESQHILRWGRRNILITGTP